VLVSLPACGPWSPVLPVAWEPLIFEVSKYESPLWVAATSLAICVYMEYINWHIYRWAVSLDALASVRDRRAVRLAVDYFGRAPAPTIAITALIPFPFWIIRVLALLRKYPLRRFLGAMTLGRAPRLLFLAWVGATLRVSTVILVAVIAIAAIAGILWTRGRRGATA